MRLYDSSKCNQQIVNNFCALALEFKAVALLNLTRWQNPEEKPVAHEKVSVGRPRLFAIAHFRITGCGFVHGQHLFSKFRWVGKYGGEQHLDPRLDTSWMVSFPIYRREHLDL